MSALLILGAMGLAGAALLALPLITKRRATSARSEFDRTVFRDQLDEVERDVARGVINQADAEAARTEIQRRILATAEAEDEPATAPKVPRGARGTVAALAVLAPLAAGAMYFALGSPDLPGQPFASREQVPDAPAGPTTEQIGRMVAALEQRLAEKPDEIQGWIILTTAYLRVGRPADAEKALARALDLAGDDKARGASIAANYGEALVAMAGGRVTPGAKSAFERALVLSPKHPAAGYYLGLAQLQAGDVKGAIAVWRRIADGAPKDAPWLDELKKRIERLVREQGSGPGQTPPATGR
jgi:cytochrome c-type biogenesis protein CcmH